MDSNDILFIIIWILSILLIIHFSHKIITFVTENFESKTSPDDFTITTTKAPVVSTVSPVTTPNPNIFNDSNICDVNDCPLASVLSNYPTIGEKWGDHEGECVKVVNNKNAVCARCPPGTFVDYTNIDGVCTKCPPGQYSDKPNSLSCKPCKNARGEGQQICSSDTNDEIDLFNPSKENDEKISALYENNIRNLKQFQTLNDRINNLSNILNSMDTF